jgi:hypothetical protein
MLRILLLTIILCFFLSQQIEPYTQQQIATDRDILLATKEAFRKRCVNNGYIWKESGDVKTSTATNQPSVLSSGTDEFRYDCLHTRETCLKNSIYPTYAEDPPSYYEWRSEPGNDRCVIGNEGFRDFCEKEGLTYEPETGNCKTNKQYCFNKGLPFCNGDCYVPPGQWLSEQIFGTTLGRTLAQASPERWIAEAACPA